jgi:uncharacterized DUF497 family protein
MTYVEELIWDDRNLEHIARHGVSRFEVEQVCYSDAFIKRTRNQLLAVYGQTESGRYLIVFLGRRGQGVYYPVTARDMIDRERRAFRGSKRR